MTKRIFRSICLVAFTVFLATVALIMGVLYQYFSNIEQAQLKMQTTLAAQGVTNEGIAYFRDLDLTNYRISWIDTTGNVIFDSTSDTEEMGNHWEREEVQEAMSSGYGESIRYSATLMERSLYCAQKLKDGTILRLSISQNTIFTLLLGMMQPLGIVFLIAFILSIIPAIQISKKIVQPLNKMEKENAEQMRREFTANVSHELKTPLHSISGYAELLKNDLVRDCDKIPFAGKIYDEAQRMIRLVEDIISLSRLDEGGNDMQREDTDLYELAKKAVGSLETQVETAGISITCSGESAVLDGIPRLLYSIVYNLCDNAIKYNQENGSVNVTVKRTGNDILLTVKDTGIGIAPEHQERIFERFYRVDKSHSNAVGGTGLGLSIVKHAAKIHHAKVEIESAVGKGTTVTVVLPTKG